MSRLDARLILGFLLVAAGIIYLLNNFGVIAWGDAVTGTAAAIGAVLLLALFARDRANMWWALIPGMALLGLAATMLLTTFAPPFAQAWGGGIFLGSIGVGFIAVYLTQRDFWWAIIPGGVMTTLAIVAAMDNLVTLGPVVNSGGFFFLGLAATFAVVALAPGRQGQLSWAFIPAAVLAVFGVLILVGWETGIGYLWPVALIGAGIFLLFRAYRRAR